MENVEVIQFLREIAAFQKKMASEVFDIKMALRAHKKEMTSKEVRSYLNISKGKLTQLKQSGVLELSHRKRLGKIKGDYYYTDSVIRYKQNQ